MILVLLFLLLTVTKPQNFHGTITSSSSRAGATVQHFLTATFTNYTIPAGGYIELTYTTGWTVSSTARANSGDYCQTGCSFASIALTVSSQSIKISNLFPISLISGYVSVGISLKNIINPKLALTDTLSLSLFDSANIQLGTTSISLQIYPSVMGCSVAPSNTTVTAITTYLFTVTPNPSVPLDSTGTLDLTFPTVWSNSERGPTFAYSSCSNVGSTIGCSVFGTTITASGLFSGGPSTSAFSFNLNNVINPGSLKSNEELALNYKLANGSVVGMCSCLISGLQAAAISNVSFDITDKIGTLIFTNMLPAMITDELLLTFPSEFYLGDVQNIIEKINGTNQPYLEPTKLTNQNKLLLTPFRDSYLNTFTISISNIYLLYPFLAGPVTVAFTRYGYVYSQATVSYSLSAKASLSPSLVLTETLMKSKSDYSITFAPTYYQSNYFLLDFCTGFTLTVNQVYECYLNSAQPSSGMNCTATSATQIKVSLTNSSANFSNVFGYESNYTLVIVGITNPSQTSCSLTMHSYMLPASELEYSNSVSLTYSAIKIIEASLSISVGTVGAVATYTFTVNNTNVLGVNSELHIYFPSVFDISGISFTLDNAAVTFTIVNSTYAFVVIANSMAQYALASHSFQAIGVKNPSSLKPPPSFGLQLRSGGFVLQSISEGLFARMTTLAHFTSLSLSTSSLIAGQTASYTITFSYSINILNISSLILYFQLPNSYTFVSCNACSGFQRFAITTSTTSVTVSKIINPEAITEPSPITVSLEIDGYLAIQDTLASPNFTFADLNYGVSSNSSYLGEPATVNVTIDMIPLATTYLILTVPSEYTIGTLSLWSINCGVSFIRSGNILNITLSSVNAANISLWMQGLTNPVSTPSSLWSLAVYTSSYVLIGKGVSLNKFTATCGTNCMQCINSTYCLSCYNNSLVNSFTVLDYSTNTCVSSCNSSQFIKNSTCYMCHTNCKTCDRFSQNCTSCQLPSLLLNWVCLTACPEGYYASGSNCLPCSNNCGVCNSSSLCLSCSSGFILQANNSCLSNCPLGSYNYSNACTVCPTNCTTCSQSGCSACISANYLCRISLTICVSECPQGYYLSSNSTWCQLCKSPCLTCLNISTSCSSCNTASIDKYLFNSTCSTACPSGKYADQLLQCQPCLSPCANCYSATNCSSCLSNYYLYSPLGQCVMTCISNTISINGSCVQCSAPCLTCTGSLSTCTSCVSNYFLLSNATCTNTCLPPNTPYQGLCNTCLLPCTACDPANISTCYTCMAGYFLYSSACYSACPTHTYQKTSALCELCSSPCAQCSGTASTCTSCYNSSYLFNSTCYNPCPANYFISGSSCISCRPECSSCPFTAADECSSCSSVALYYNPITYHCTANCSSPYHATTTAPLECLPCQLPCKTCANYYNQCNDCYTGYFYLNQQCQSSCPSNYYEDGVGNICVICPSLCATCTSLGCSTCSGGNYFYGGNCYAVCPVEAPFIYGAYCRNCLIDYCILCNADKICTLCDTNYVNYNGRCLTECPDNYEPDKVSGSRCIKKRTVAFAEFIEYLEGMKIFVLPATLLLLLLLLLVPWAEIKLFGLAFILAGPQTLVLTEFAIFYYYQWHKLESKGVNMAVWLGWCLLIIHHLISIIYVCVMWKDRFSGKKDAQKWMAYGSNSCRFKTILVTSLVNKQVLNLVFSGLFQIPITSLPFKAPNRLFYGIQIAYIIFEVAACFIGAVIIIPKQTLHYNNLLIVFFCSLIVDIVFTVAAHKQAAPTPYQKYILPAVSNRSLPALSEPQQDAIDEPNAMGLHRSGSDQNLFESKEMKEVDYKSVFDLNDYYEETPKVEDIEDALVSGKFRKKNKKKRGNRRGRKLDVIEEESDDEDEQQEEERGMKTQGKGKKAKPTKKKKEEQVGGLSNFIYWRKPKQKKANPGKVFKQNEQLIMSRIKQKQSQFDTITQNDIVFQEQIDWDNSSNEDYQIQHQSRRALNKPPKINYYDNLFNLNYAERDHMGE